jgi:hypothetical protein
MTIFPLVSTSLAPQFGGVFEIEAESVRKVIAPLRRESRYFVSKHRGFT